MPNKSVDNLITQMFFDNESFYRWQATRSLFENGRKVHQV